MARQAAGARAGAWAIRAPLANLHTHPTSSGDDCISHRPLPPVCRGSARQAARQAFGTYLCGGEGAGALCDLGGLKGRRSGKLLRDLQLRIPLQQLGHLGPIGRRGMLIIGANTEVSEMGSQGD